MTNKTIRSKINRPLDIHGNSRHKRHWATADGHLEMVSAMLVGSGLKMISVFLPKEAGKQLKDNCSIRLDF